jgi:hypothetical protein
MLGKLLLEGIIILILSRTYDDFRKNVPIRDYEALRPYVDRVVNGEEDILWRGKTIVFCKNIRYYFWLKIHSYY